MFMLDEIIEVAKDNAAEILENNAIKPEAKILSRKRNRMNTTERKCQQALNTLPIEASKMPLGIRIHRTLRYLRNITQCTIIYYAFTMWHITTNPDTGKLKSMFNSHVNGFIIGLAIWILLNNVNGYIRNLLRNLCSPDRDRDNDIFKVLNYWYDKEMHTHDSWVFNISDKTLSNISNWKKKTDKFIRNKLIR